MEVPSTKFHGNPSGGSRADTRRETDGWALRSQQELITTTRTLLKSFKLLHSDSCCLWTDIVIFKIYQSGDFVCDNAIAPVSAVQLGLPLKEEFLQRDLL